MENYLRNLIKQGENQQLDFKFEISDSKKLAKTISAFSNTDGGTLLIGVKDNGSIAGVRHEEEFYMMEGAAQVYCKPPVNFTTKRWVADGKVVLEVTIPESQTKPHLAKTDNDKWLAYIRVADQNLLANGVMLRVWRHQSDNREIIINYTEKEKILLDYLAKNESITLSKYAKIAFVTHRTAEEILSKLIVLHIIEIIFTEKQVFYKLANGE